MSTSDKNSTKDRTDIAEPPDDNASERGLDSAWKFLDQHRNAAAGGGSAPIDMAALRRKIDWHIVPLMFLCYTLQFLDKVILNVSGQSPFVCLHDMTRHILYTQPGPRPRG